MSELVVLGELPREWTLDDLALLPDDGHRYEIVDGGLHVSPPPGAPHQFAAAELCFRLRLATPPDLAVTQGLGVDLGRTTLIPDLVVVPRRAVPGAALVRPADVLLAVEIVSPSSVSMDRLLKPARYAEAGIQSYWRVDGVSGDEPSITVYDLDGIHYRETAVIHAGEQVAVDRPFRVTLAPAQLVP